MPIPIISIVLPTYNGARYIKQSIESCLQQTFSDFELIIVNDCSTDKTATIIEEYAACDSRIRVIHNTYNKKLPLSLNVGFDVAKGRYHTWTSDDNCYGPTALYELYKILEADEQIGLVYTDVSLIDINGRIFGKRIQRDIYKSFSRWQGCGACFLYRAAVYQINKGYNPAAFLVEDYDFFVRAFLQFRFHYVSRHDLYYYREHEHSLTSLQRDYVNYIGKMMIEKQTPLLEQKLPKSQLSLLYRKFAVFNAVQKNNASKYTYYLRKLWHISRYEAMLTVFFVPFKKLSYVLTVSMAGFVGLTKIRG